MKKKKNNTLTTLILVIAFLIGLSLVLYPTVANYVNSLHSSKAISEYSDAVERLTAEEYEKILKAAREYNEKLYRQASGLNISEEMKEEYWSLLDLNGSGVMGYIEIPSIDVSLPIFHGTAEKVLQIAAGHLEWTSLPIGGENTHSVLSGHRGLPSAKLFTDLDRLVEGDIFTIRVLNEIITYEVDQINIVLPQNASDLQIIPNEDYCTLVTCTPYGINDHRLLVRGRRIANAEEAAFITIPAELVQINPLIVSAFIAIPVLIIFILLELFVMNPGKRRRKKKVDWHLVKRD